MIDNDLRLRYAKDRAKLMSQISEALKMPRDFGYHGDLPIGDTWTLGPVIETRDSGLLDQSNAAILQKMLESREEFNGQWEIVHCGHWAVGWVDHLSFKVITEVLHSSVPTKIAQFIFEKLEYLKNVYPILDEQDYSRREHDALYENMQNEVPYQSKRLGFDLPEDWYDTLSDWYDNNLPNALENIDDRGGYPVEEDLLQAFQDLGWYSEE